MLLIIGRDYDRLRLDDIKSSETKETEVCVVERPAVLLVSSLPGVKYHYYIICVCLIE